MSLRSFVYSPSRLPIGTAVFEWNPRTSLRAVGVFLVVLALASFALHLFLMHQFEEPGLFLTPDVLFDSDSHEALAIFSHGKRSIRKIHPDLLNSVHPFLSFYFAPVIRTIANLAVSLNLTTMGEMEFRVAMGVFVTPTIAALQTFAFGFLLYAVGIEGIALVLVSLLNAVSFSNLLYGSIPEHFMLTNLGVTLLLLLVATATRSPRFGRWQIWAAVGAFLTGITSTNAAMFGIANLLTKLHSDRQSFWRAARDSILLTVSVAGLVVGSGHLIGLAMEGPMPPDAYREDFIRRFWRTESSWSTMVDDAVKAVGDAVAPTQPDIRELQDPLVPETFSGVVAPFATRSFFPLYTFESTDPASSFKGPLGLIVTAGVVIGAILMMRCGGTLRLVAVVSSAVVGFNLVFHGVWGSGYFLYSQHWISASLVLVGGLFLIREPMRRAVAIGFACFVVAAAVSNAAILWHLIAASQAAMTGIAG